MVLAGAVRTVNLTIDIRDFNARLRVYSQVAVTHICLKEDIQEVLANVGNSIERLRGWTAAVAGYSTVVKVRARDGMPMA